MRRVLLAGAIAGVLLAGCAEGTNCPAIACAQTLHFHQLNYQESKVIVPDERVRPIGGRTVSACVYTPCVDTVRVRIGTIRDVAADTALAMRFDGHWLRVDAEPPPTSR